MCGDRPLGSMAVTDSVAVIGDSFTRGTEMGGFRAPQAWPRLVQELLTEQNIEISLAVGADRGSGYVKRGSKGTTFADQIPNVVDAQTRLVVVFGSLNDGSVLPDQLASAVRHTLLAAEDSAPCAKLLVIGPAWPNSNPPARILSTRDVVRSEALSVAGTFIDPISASWFVDRPELIGPDGVHPTDAGHIFMAARLTPAIAQLLVSAGA